MPDWGAVTALALCFAASLYIRGPALVVALATHALLLLLAALAPADRPRALLRIGLGLALFLGLLAPWSMASSRHFGAPVLTTTNFPLVIAESFGSREETCFGPCPPGVDVWPGWHFSQAYAARTGQNPLVVQQAMMRASLEGMTMRAYLARVRSHFGNLLFDPGHYLRASLPRSYSLPGYAKGPAYAVMTGLTVLLYVPFMAALLAVVFVPITRSADLRLQALLIKAGALGALLQPFVHYATGRYWLTLTPLAAWAVVVLWQNAATPARTTSQNPGRSAVWLDGGQNVLSAALAILTGLILLA